MRRLGALPLVSIWTSLLYSRSVFISAIRIPSDALTTSTATSKTSDALIISKPEIKSTRPPKSFGFLDDNGSIQGRLVETTTSSGEWIDGDHQEEEAIETKSDQQHQVSYKDLSSRQRRITTTNRHMKSSLLTIILAALLSPFIAVVQQLVEFDHKTLQILRVVACCLYLLECMFSSTRRYLSNGFSPSDFMEYTNKLKEAEPKIVWVGECYHYRHVRRHHHGHGGNRHSTISTSREKVVTHVASETFEVGNWKDVTSLDTIDRAIQIGGRTDKNHKNSLSSSSSKNSTPTATFLKITLSKLFILTNPTIAGRYFMQESLFKEREGRWDLYFDFTRYIRIDDNFRHKVLIIRTGLSDVAFASQLWFWIASFMGLTVPYRIWFSQHCQHGELTVTKEIDE